MGRKNRGTTRPSDVRISALNLSLSEVDMTLRTSVIAAVAAALLAGACASGYQPDPAEAGKIGYPSADAALAAVRARPGVAESQKDGWTIIEDKAHYETWYFSPAGHPARPAVIKRTLFSGVSGSRTQTAAMCGGGQAECDKLVAQLQAADKGSSTQGPANIPAERPRSGTGSRY